MLNRIENVSATRRKKNTSISIEYAHTHRHDHARQQKGCVQNNCPFKGRVRYEILHVNYLHFVRHWTRCIGRAQDVGDAETKGVGGVQSHFFRYTKTQSLRFPPEIPSICFFFFVMEGFPQKRRGRGERNSSEAALDHILAPYISDRRIVSENIQLPRIRAEYLTKRAQSIGGNFLSHGMKCSGENKALLDIVQEEELVRTQIILLECQPESLQRATMIAMLRSKSNDLRTQISSFKGRPTSDSPRSAVEMLVAFNMIN